MRISFTVFAIVLSVPIAGATQSKMAFEVASVKPVDPMTSYGCGDDRVDYLGGSGFRIKPIPPSLVGAMPLGCLIALAFDVTPREVIGGPNWLFSDLFAIDARASGPVTHSDTNQMLRALLAERFGLVARLEPNKTIKKWVLTLAHDDGRLGPGLRHAAVECVTAPRNAPVSQRQLRPDVAVPCGSAVGATGVRAGGGQPFSALLFPIQLAVGDEVIDRTGLTGLFDFYVNLPRARALVPGQQDPDGPSVFTAVQEQLGLKLQQEDVTRAAVIVERVSRPLPN